MVAQLVIANDAKVGPDIDPEEGRHRQRFARQSSPDPVSDYDALGTHVGHGGFRRFSGRLLRIDLSTSAVEVIVEGLDTPTNITLSGNRAYIAQGMGTPGRQIPSEGGTVAIDGFIEVVVLPD